MFLLLLVHRFETILSPQGTNRRNQRYYLIYNSEDCAVLSLTEASYASFTYSARIRGPLYFWFFWLLGSSLYQNKTSWWKNLTVWLVDKFEVYWEFIRNYVLATKISLMIRFSFQGLLAPYDFRKLEKQLEKIFLRERAALEAKYQKLYEPLYTKVCRTSTGN